MRSRVGRGLALLGALALPVAAGAATVPFTEDFTASDGSWRGNPNAVGSLDGWSATGGADGGGYVSEGYNFVSSVFGQQGPVIFRGPASASGGSFAGNWIADAVREVTVYVRHDAPVPIDFFARFASPMGFPGAIAGANVSVAPGVWTELTFAIDPTSSQWQSFEGSDFATVFSSIGTVQIGATTPEALAGIDLVVHFDLDSVSIVPEPASVALLAQCGQHGARTVGAARGHAGVRAALVGANEEMTAVLDAHAVTARSVSNAQRLPLMKRFKTRLMIGYLRRTASAKRAISLSLSL